MGSLEIRLYVAIKYHRLRRNTILFMSIPVSHLRAVLIHNAENKMAIRRVHVYQSTSEVLLIAVSNAQLMPNVHETKRVWKTNVKIHALGHVV